MLLEARIRLRARARPPDAPRSAAPAGAAPASRRSDMPCWRGPISSPMPRMRMSSSASLKPSVIARQQAQAVRGLAPTDRRSAAGSGCGRLRGRHGRGTGAAAPGRNVRRPRSSSRSRSARRRRPRPPRSPPGPGSHRRRMRCITSSLSLRRPWTRPSRRSGNTSCCRRSNSAVADLATTDSPTRRSAGR